MSPDERAHGLSPSDKFDMIGHAKGITEADEQYFEGCPDELDRIRLVSEDDVEAPAATTHVQILEHVDFNGNRTGYRNRSFLRRIERRP